MVLYQGTQGKTREAQLKTETVLKRACELYRTEKVKRLPPKAARRDVRKLEDVDLATNLEELIVPPGNRLRRLECSRN